MDKQELLNRDLTSDEEIITRILQGDKNMYAAIVRRYNQRLYRIAMSIINDSDEAEDTIQVSYIKAYEHLGQFGFKASFSTWLTRILINESLLRLRTRRKQINLKEDFTDNEIYQHQTSAVKTPITTMLNSELKVILEQSVLQLPEKYRTIFVMREIEGMNVAETGQCLDISEVNVKVRLNRAKALLKKSLSSFYKKEDILHFHLTRCDRIVSHVMRQL